MEDFIMSTTKKIVYTGLFIALALLLPQLFHFLPIGNVGKIILPMHIPVILAGYFLGVKGGMLVGILSPLISSIIFQMPSILILPMMIVELCTYGIMAGVFYKKIKNNYLSLGLVIASGRIANGFMYVIMINVFGIEKINMEMFFTTLSIGIPGVILQFIVIPPMINFLKKKRDKKQ